MDLLRNEKYLIQWLRWTSVNSENFSKLIKLGCGEFVNFNGILVFTRLATQKSIIKVFYFYANVCLFLLQCFSTLSDLKDCQFDFIYEIFND